ncbi:MAG: hypothetical protein FWF72_03990 [Paludibacter sp.]|nr:hypothetical protein [Paludibacter sp.]
MRKLTAILFVFLIFCVNIFSQSVNIGDLGSSLKKPVRINGGLSLGTMLYGGNEASVNRQPFTYFINGNLNFTFFGIINMPFTMNFNNLGAKYSYPSLPNRLSLHPSYKWITAHIGDISMTFSPYTLSGHQFTGGGLELSPKKFKIALMGGRLLKEVKPNAEIPYLLPNNSRFGYGAQFQYDGSAFSAGMTFFTGKDHQNRDLEFILDSLGRAPQKNVSMSWNAVLNPVKNLSLRAEYAISAMTSDVRAMKDEKPDFWQNLFGGNSSTNIYNALNVNISYQFLKNTVGVGYERIDPQYATLGAYYFNNDFENITLNYSRPFFQDKASIAVRFGLQHDDLDNTKEEKSTRYVGSLNLNYNPTEQLQTTFSYSTFQSHRNLKSQFDYINELSPYDNMDTLRFAQLSQNLDASLMYNFIKTETESHSVNVMASYQEAANRQGQIILPGNVTRFVNSALGYSVQLIPQAININASVNGTYNYMGKKESFTYGPTAAVTAGFLKKTLTTGISTAYNVNTDSDVGIQAKVFNLRYNLAYRLLKRHNFSAGFIWQNRNLKDKNPSNLTTGTFNYSFSF